MPEGKKGKCSGGSGRTRLEVDYKPGIASGSHGRRYQYDSGLSDQ